MRAFSRWALATLVAALVVFSVALLADSAKADTLSCAPVDQAVELLVTKYGEALVGVGDGPNGTRLFIFARPDGNTWTVLGLLPDGKACFIASGSNWEAAAPIPPGSET